MPSNRLIDTALSSGGEIIEPNRKNRLAPADSYLVKPGGPASRVTILQIGGKRFAYFNFFSSFAFLFSLMDFAGFFLTSFLISLDFAITNLLCA
jgi:hypothetical protein